MSGYTSAIAYGVAAVVGAYSAYSASEQSKAAANYQEDVNRNNAKMAEYAAVDAENRGARDIEESNKRARAMRGAQEARLASNGLMLDSGSALNILEDTDLLAEADARLIRDNARREAWGYRVQGQNFNSSANMYRSAAKNERPGLSAASSLLGSATQYYSANSGR